MRIGVLINEFTTLAHTQTTAAIMHRAALGGHHVHVFGVAELSVSASGRIEASTRMCDPSRPNVADQIRHLSQAESDATGLESLDLILIRTNPARDDRGWAHTTALQLLAQVRDAGTAVINDPDGLREAGSKLFLSQLPGWTVPRTIITADPARLEFFVREAPGPTVLKPVHGTRGEEVFKLRPESENLGAILGVLVRKGFVVAQDFVPAAVKGDVRVIVLDGDVLEIDGRCAAVHRVPKKRDFRSNLHAGGRAEPGTVTSEMRAAVQAIGEILVGKGIRLAGLDFLGGVICEANVFSTGGFVHAERFFDRPFLDHTIETLLGSRPD
ncbi:MAG: glutathione synthase [Bradymonadia bacterium]|jgi:glutathione synthase